MLEDESQSKAEVRFEPAEDDGGRDVCWIDSRGPDRPCLLLLPHDLMEEKNLPGFEAGVDGAL